MFGCWVCGTIASTDTDFAEDILGLVNGLHPVVKVCSRCFPSWCNGWLGDNHWPCMPQANITTTAHKRKLKYRAFELISLTGVTYIPSHDLRSADAGLLCLPQVYTKRKGERAFSHCAPRLWNALPPHIRSATQLMTLSKLKITFLD